LLRPLTSGIGTKRLFYGVPANVCSWGKSGHAADITAMTDFDPGCVKTSWML